MLAIHLKNMLSGKVASPAENMSSFLTFRQAGEDMIATRASVPPSTHSKEEAGDKPTLLETDMFSLSPSNASSRAIATGGVAPSQFATVGSSFRSAAAGFDKSDVDEREDVEADLLEMTSVYRADFEVPQDMNYVFTEDFDALPLHTQVYMGGRNEINFVQMFQGREEEGKRICILGL